LEPTRPDIQVLSKYPDSYLPDPKIPDPVRVRTLIITQVMECHPDNLSILFVNYKFFILKSTRVVGIAHLKLALLAINTSAMMESICLIIVWITMEKVRLNVKNRIVILINVG